MSQQRAERAKRNEKITTLMMTFRRAREASFEAYGAASGGWCYLDDDQLVQGPFEDDEIAEWYVDRHMTDELLMRPDAMPRGVRFRPLLEVMEGRATWERRQAESIARETDEPPRTSIEPLTRARRVKETPTRRPLLTSAVAAALARGSHASWCYLDDTQAVQGPFTNDELVAWYADGALKPDLLMRPSGAPNSTAFRPLLQIVEEFDQTTEASARMSGASLGGHAPNTVAPLASRSALAPLAPLRAPLAPLRPLAPLTSPRAL